MPNLVQTTAIKIADDSLGRPLNVPVFGEEFQKLAGRAPTQQEIGEFIDMRDTLTPSSTSTLDSGGIPPTVPPVAKPTAKPSINQQLTKKGISTSATLTPFKSYDDLVTNTEEAGIRSKADERLKQMTASIGSQYSRLIQERKRRGTLEKGGAEARLGITRGLGASSSRMQFLQEMQRNIDTDVTTLTEKKAEAMAKLDFQMADKVDKQIRDLESVRFKAQQVSYTQQLQAMQEQRLQAGEERKTTADYVARLKTIAETGAELPDDLVTQIDQLYGEGFSKKYVDIAKTTAQAKTQADKITSATKIIDLLGKIPEGETIKIGDNEYTGLKTSDPKTQLFSETDAAGNVTYVTIDKTTGKIISKASGGAIGKGRAPKTPKDTTTSDAIENMRKQLSTVVGDDGYVSPDDYKKARSAWVKKGLDPSTFDTKMKGFTNPNNPNYITAKKTTTKKSKSLSSVQRGFEALSIEQKLKTMGKKRGDYAKLLKTKTGEEADISKDFTEYINSLIKKYRDAGKSDEEIAALMQ